MILFLLPLLLHLFLLGRHNYGRGKGLLIIPGGFINEGELPAEAAER
ncbi:NUDIX hydrolase, partial [Brachyspira hyodysenteriae]